MKAEERDMLEWNRRECGVEDGDERGGGGRRR